MFKFSLSSNQTIYSENPNFVKLDDSGNFKLCSETEAIGVNINNSVYHFDKSADKHIISYENLDLGQILNEMKQTLDLIVVKLSESGQISDDKVGQYSSSFSDWQASVDYKVNQFVKYNQKLYKCLQDHTSQENWKPNTTASLWELTKDPSEKFPEWSQPIGAMDAYTSGDKVSYNSKHWISNQSVNVWAPGIYGWDEYTEPESNIVGGPLDIHGVEPRNA